MRNLKTYAAHALNTVFGIYQHKFSEDWDKDLNLLMDKGTFIEGGPHTIKISYGGKMHGIWVSNRWYSFGHIYTLEDVGNIHSYKSVSRNSQRRARIRTMIRLHEYNMANNEYLTDKPFRVVTHD